MKVLFYILYSIAAYLGLLFVASGLAYSITDAIYRAKEKHKKNG